MDARDAMSRRSSYRLIRICHNVIHLSRELSAKSRIRKPSADWRPRSPRRRIERPEARPTQGDQNVHDDRRRSGAPRLSILATGAMAAAGAAAVAWPLIDQMNPDASTAAGASIDRSVAHRRGSDRHRQIPRRPAVHPAADGQGDRRRRRHQSRRTQGPADRRAARPKAGVVDRVGNLHPPRLRPDRPRRSL